MEFGCGTLSGIEVKLPAFCLFMYFTVILCERCDVCHFQVTSSSCQAQIRTYWKCHACDAMSHRVLKRNDVCLEEEDLTVLV